MVLEVSMKVSVENKDMLDRIKLHHRETYNEVIGRLGQEELNRIYEDEEDGIRPISITRE